MIHKVLYPSNLGQLNTLSLENDSPFTLLATTPLPWQSYALLPCILMQSSLKPIKSPIIGDEFHLS